MTTAIVSTATTQSGRASGRSESSSGPHCSKRRGQSNDGGDRFTRTTLTARGRGDAGSPRRALWPLGPDRRRPCRRALPSPLAARSRGTQFGRGSRRTERTPDSSRTLLSVCLESDVRRRRALLRGVDVCRLRFVRLRSQCDTGASRCGGCGRCLAHRPSTVSCHCRDDGGNAHLCVAGIKLVEFHEGVWVPRDRLGAGTPRDLGSSPDSPSGKDRRQGRRSGLGVARPGHWRRLVGHARNAVFHPARRGRRRVQPSSARRPSQLAHGSLSWLPVPSWVPSLGSWPV